MNRIEVIQKLIDKKNGRTYLEVGVCSGGTFLQIRIPRKIGIDIKFSFSGKKSILKRYFKNFKSNIFNKYYQMKSDDFFIKHNRLFKNSKIDIAFIDGLHEYNQVIRDVNNCLNFLSKNGVIVLHDCNPDSMEHAYPPEKRITNVWFGDTWKAIVYFRSYRQDLNVFVLDSDCGLGVITRGKPDKMLMYSMDSIKDLSYNDLEKDRVEMLNLKSVEYFEGNFLKEQFK